MNSDRAPPPVLYSFRRCPYAMRARLALKVSRCEVEIREVKLSAKPATMLAASPKATVPVLVLTDGRVIDESLDIMQWALENSDPQNWLASNLVTHKSIFALIAESDGPFKFNLDRYKYPARYADVDPIVHRNAGAEFISGLNDKLAHQNFLFGDSPNIADMAIAPFVRQFSMTDLVWFQAQKFPNTRRWLECFLQSELFESIMHKHPVWQPNSG